MNRFLKVGLSAIGLGILISAISVTSVNAQGPLTDIMRRMDLNNKSLQSLTADIRMLKFNAQLNIPDDTYSGTTSYLPKTASRGAYIRIDWEKPVQEKVSVMGDKYELWRLRLNQVVYGNTDKASKGASAGNALSLFSMSRDQLRANYDVIYIGDETLSSGTPTFHLQMTPKTKANYKMADLWVDQNGMPQQAKILETNNDTTTIQLTNIKKNVTIKAAIFKLEYDPKKVSRIAG